MPQEGGDLGKDPGTWIHTPQGGHVTITMANGTKKEVHIKAGGWYQVPDGATDVQGHLSSSMKEHIEVYQGDPKSFGTGDQNKNFPYKKDIGDAGMLNQMMTPDRFKDPKEKGKDPLLFKLNPEPEPPPPDKKTKVSLPSSDTFGDGLAFNSSGQRPSSRDVMENQEDKENQEQRDDHKSDVE